jgi:hypothetical protein
LDGLDVSDAGSEQTQAQKKILTYTLSEEEDFKENKGGPSTPKNAKMEVKKETPNTMEPRAKKRKVIKFVQ